MSSRLTLIAGLLVLGVGCSTQTKALVARPSVAVSVADPQRWERRACLRGELPPELDSRAFARARYEDFQASSSPRRSPLATERLLEQREEFDARCGLWRREASLATSVPSHGRSGI